MLFRLIKPLTISVYLLLSGCFGNAPELPHPYLKTANDLEARANQALLLGQYPQAYQLYGRALETHTRLDDTSNRARLLLNQLQIALTIESMHRANKTYDQLISLSQNRALSGDVSQQLILLGANKALLEQQWDESQQLLARLDNANTQLYASALVSQALLNDKTGRDAPDVLNKAFTAAADQPLLLARLQRLTAEQALKRGQIDIAEQNINAAKQAYQAAYYLPGVAECLLLEAALLELQGKAGQSIERRSRAADIWRHLGNNSAAARITAQDSHR